MEYTIFSHREHQPPAVGRYAGQCGTHAQSCSVKHQSPLAESHRLGVERLLIDIVFHLPAPTDDLPSAIRRVGVFEVRTAIIQRLAVGRPAGEYLQLVGVVLDVRHLIALHVVGYHVALGVEHLNLVRVCHLERLTRQVRGINDEFQPRVPGGIHTCRQDGVVAHIDFPHLAVVGDDRSAHVLTGVELHALRVKLLVVVAVDALTTLLALRATQDVVVDDALVVVLQTTLADGQFLIADVRRIDQAVAQVRVDAVLRHVDVERLVLRPLTVVAGVHLHSDALVQGFLHQPLPFVLAGFYLRALQQQLFVVHGEPRHHVVGPVVHLKRQRRHVHRHRHALVVGVNVGHVARRRIFLRSLHSTGGHHHRHHHQ